MESIGNDVMVRQDDCVRNIKSVEISPPGGSKSIVINHVLSSGDVSERVSAGNVLWLRVVRLTCTGYLPTYVVRGTSTLTVTKSDLDVYGH